MSDRGAAAVELAAGIGLLLLPAVLLVLSFAPWAEAQIMARVVVRDAARTVATTGSVAEAAELAAETVSVYGFDPGEVQVTFSGSTGRAGLVTATVEVQMPVVVIPGLADIGRVSWTVQHTEQVDLYRSLP